MDPNHLLRLRGMEYGVLNQSLAVLRFDVALDLDPGMVIDIGCSRGLTVYTHHALRHPLRLDGMN